MPLPCDENRCRNVRFYYDYYQCQFDSYVVLPLLMDRKIILMIIYVVSQAKLFHKKLQNNKQQVKELIKLTDRN